MKIIIKNIQELAMFAQDFASKLKGGEILALVGNLGAGKTAFTKALAKALGIEETVISPTFNLVKVYSLKNNEDGIKRICHMDFYRLNTKEEAVDLGILDYFSENSTVSIVEWADKFKEIFPDRTIWLNFKYVGKNIREIIVED